MPTPLPSYKGHSITLNDAGTTFRATKDTQVVMEAPSLAALKKRLDALKPAPTFGQKVLVTGYHHSGMFAAEVTGWAKPGRSRWDRGGFTVLGTDPDHNGTSTGHRANNLYHDTEANRANIAKVVALSLQIQKLEHERAEADAAVTAYTEAELLGTQAPEVQGS